MGIIIRERMFAPDLSFQPKGLAERVGCCILAGLCASIVVGAGVVVR